MEKHSDDKPVVEYTAKIMLLWSLKQRDSNQSMLEN